jgi:predicted ATPase/DNA-binding CsgD family transcriptional regulator
MSDPTPITRPGPIPLAPPNRQGLSLSANLPSPITSLIGRERETAEIVSLIRRPDVRLVTLTGPGGVGKTRLAIESARMVREEFSGGVAFIALDVIRDPLLVAPTILQAFGLHISGDGVIEDQLAAALGDAPFLLVLDNYEQVTDAALLPRDLVARCPELKVLITSREPLHIDGEHEFTTPPLSLVLGNQGEPLDSAAVRLFVERAVEPDLLGNAASAAAIVEICRRLDGLPLAIELAAARTKVLPPKALLERMDRRLPLFTSVARDRPVRFRTMRDAITWSYDLLTPTEQEVFRRLAVFAGGFTLEGAEAISQGLSDERTDSSALDAIQALMDKSLLVRRCALNGEPRFTMLETIREFAGDQLVAAGESTAVKTDHATYFLSFAERHERAGWVKYAPSLPACFEADLPNFRAALAWLDETGDAEGVLQVASALRWFWSARGFVHEGRRWLERGLAGGGTVQPSIQGRALMALGQFSFFQGDEPRARALFEEALILQRAEQDPFATAFALSALASLANGRGEFALAVRLFEEAWALTEELHDREKAASLAAVSMSGIGMAAHGLGDLTLAAECAEQALDHYRKLDYLPGLTSNLLLSATIAHDRSDDTVALSRYQDGLGLASEYGEQRVVAPLIEGIALIAATSGEAAQAACLLGAAAALRERAGFQTRYPFERSIFEPAMASAEATLGEAVFAAAWAAGRGLPQEETVAEALSVQAGSPASAAEPRSSSDPTNPSDPNVTRASGLSQRELEILGLIAAGQTNQEIAADLNLSIRTVNNYATAILEKLGQPSRAAAVAFAIRDGLI